MKATKENILLYLKEIKLDLNKKGIDKIGLFGSFATNNQNIYSDIDIAISKNPNYLSSNSAYNYFELLSYIKEKIRSKFHKNIERIRIIQKKINFINSIIKEKGSIRLALDDEQNSRASILMHLTSISEQFDKLLHNGELEILSKFDKQDIKGSYELRNFIAHDYEGVDLYIVEDVIKERLPIIRKSTENILNS
jgi:predicted nucleotidyltransferase